MQQTLCIIKPDAVQRELVGEILSAIQKSGLHVAALKMVHLSKSEAECFYSTHKGKHFFGGLIEYMCSGPSVAVVLKGENAIQRYRALMGATDPTQADAGTLRKQYAISTSANTVHGSDSIENAAVEVPFFFSTREIIG